MPDEKSLLSRRVKALREERGWSIAELARRTGVSVSMLWKVENAQTSLTYGKLAKLAAGLEAPIGELFASSEPGVLKGGRRVVERGGSGPAIDVGSNLHSFRAADIANKHYSPCVVEIRATGDGSDAETHAGEEFTYVLEGRIRFICGGYAPVVLEVGDSVYFDASQPHRYLCVDGAPAKILCIYSHPENAKADAVPPVEMHSLAMRVLGGLGAANEPPPRTAAGKRR